MCSQFWMQPEVQNVEASLRIVTDTIALEKLHFQQVFVASRCKLKHVYNKRFFKKTLVENQQTT